jgi:uncharacterized membrane protein YccC
MCGVSLVNWLGKHDPGYAATRRATRTALVMPALFAIGDKVIANPALATFAAFGTFAQLTLVDFPGTIRERVESQLTLAVAGAAAVCLGTLVSRSTALAAIAMAVVGFAVLFSGAISSVLAGATTSLLLAFILPVAIPAPASEIPDRLMGWGLAAAASLVAIVVLWPAPARNPLRTAAIAASRALAARLRTSAAYVLGSGSQDDHEAAVESSDAALAQLDRVFLATPYRPTGLSTGARTVVRLVDELRWLNEIVARSAPRRHPPGIDTHVCAVKSGVATLLERAADQLDEPARSTAALQEAELDLRARLDELEESATLRLPGPDGDGGDMDAGGIVTALDPSFRAQELSFIAAQVGRNVEFAAAADRRSFLDRLLGRQPEGLPSTLSAAQERAGSYLERHSVWLQNSVRGAAGLGLAVLVAKLAGVQHAFWVVLAALSVLRSNALNTGGSVVRGLIGTAVGFVIGGVLVQVVGTNTTLLWFLLPPAVLLAGLAPAAISFEAGQAAFTLVVLILFNILQPQGWEVGLVRIEDVALGGAVSLAVGVLFWPHGARAELRRALASAYMDSASYLARAVQFGVGRCDGSPSPSPPPTMEAANAAAAARRLDDAFRGFLAERGSKPIPLAEVTSLVNGVAGLRLAGDAVLDLWERQRTTDGDRSAARRELLAGAERMTGWYDGVAASLAGGDRVPDPLEPDGPADSRLVEAVSHDLRSRDGDATATGVRVIWTGDHLDAARRLQGLLVEPAREAVAHRGVL